MKITVIARFKIKAGKDEEFKAVMAGLSEKVMNNEEGSLMYQLTSSKEPNTYVLVERYADKAALQAHGQSEHFVAGGPAMAPCLDGAPQIEFLRDVG